VRDVAEARARSGAYSHFEPAFLELGEPGLAVAAARLASHEIHKSVVLPYFLTLGTHLERDLPRLLHEIALKYKGLRISSAPPLDGHPAFVRFSWIA
jgi:sirohydrochlorin ferrochelatase